MRIEKNLCGALVALAQINPQNCLSEDVVYQYTEQEGLSLSEISRVCIQLEDAGVRIVSQAEYDAAIALAQISPALTPSHSLSSINEIVNAFCLLSPADQTVCLLQLQRCRKQVKKEPTRQVKPSPELRIKKAFFERVDRMKLHFSYCAVLLITFFSNSDSSGKADFDTIIREFEAFYDKRLQQGLVVEKRSSDFVRLKRKKPSVRSLVLYNPSGLSYMKDYLQYNSSDNSLRITKELWRVLTDTDIAFIKESCEKKLSDYYKALQ